MLGDYLGVLTSPIADATAQERDAFPSKENERRRGQDSNSPDTDETVRRF